MKILFECGPPNCYHINMIFTGKGGLGPSLVEIFSTGLSERKPHNKDDPQNPKCPKLQLELPIIHLSPDAT